MQDKWALEEHLSTAENNTLWDSARESARNGKALTEYVETHLLDVEDRIALMDKTGIEAVHPVAHLSGRAVDPRYRDGCPSRRRHQQRSPCLLRRQVPRPAVDVRVPADPRPRR